MYIRVNIGAYICMYESRSAQLLLHMLEHMFVYMQVCIFVFLYENMNTYIHMSVVCS